MIYYDMIRFLMILIGDSLGIRWGYHGVDNQHTDIWVCLERVYPRNGTLVQKMMIHHSKYGIGPNQFPVKLIYMVYY
jgi:hypothetical protein